MSDESTPGDEGTPVGDRRVFSGRYELHRSIARGGMAEVFLAHDLLLDRPVAVKVLFPEFAVDPNFVERFRREAQAAANLNHPNIVAVYDWGQEESANYIVMEYVEGRSLAEILKDERRIHPDRAAEIGTDVAAALSFAHSNGVVHRDQKPGNILIDKQGQVKVTDFGIARAFTGGTQDALTQTGSVMGTATYFSPEQAQGQPVDPRSDLYSLGIVLYEAVTGRPPFSGETPVSIAYKHVQEAPVPPRQHNLDIPLELEAVILKLLAKNPQNRYASADDLRTDLRRYRDGMPVAAEPIMAAPAVSDATGVIPVDPTQAVYNDGTRMVPAAELPPEHQEPRRTGLFFVVLVALLALMAGLLFALSRSIDFGDGTPDLASVTVPNLVGETRDDALARLDSLGLVVDENPPERSEDIPAGIVIDQSPEEGATLDEGSPVKITVSAGPDPVEVPDVEGKQQEDAVEDLRDAGLDFAIDPVEDEDVPEGEVISQSPAAREMVDPGSTITLTVSTGGPEITVPRVAGETPTTAANILGRAGFESIDEESEPSDDVAEGRVIRTDPAAGSDVSADTTITIIISNGPATSAIPDVRGDTESDAVATLRDAGFKVKVEEQDLSPADSRDGTVLTQSPSGGNRAAPGSTVTIVIGRALAATTTTTTTTTTTAPTTTTTTTTTTSTTLPMA